MTVLARTLSSADVPLAPRESTAHLRLATLGRWVGGFVEIVLLGLVVPVVILLIGLPVAILVRRSSSLPTGSNLDAPMPCPEWAV
jgi:hypothetical protein